MLQETSKAFAMGPKKPPWLLCWAAWAAWSAVCCTDAAASARVKSLAAASSKLCCELQATPSHLADQTLIAQSTSLSRHSYMTRKAAVLSHSIDCGSCLARLNGLSMRATLCRGIHACIHRCQPSIETRPCCIHANGNTRKDQRTDPHAERCSALQYPGHGLPEQPLATVIA